MKNFLLTTALFFSSMAFSQVGINTASPKSTLDVSAKRNASGIADNTQVYGLIPPRVTRAELTDNTAVYNADQTGAMIYISDVSGGDTNPPRSNVNTVGYYYFDGTLWQKISVPYTATNGVTMSGNNLKLGGSLTEPTNISGLTGVNKLAITGTGIDAINFDNNTLSIDASNDRVGIGTNNPSEKLDVAGNISLNTNPSGTASSLKFYEDAANGANSISIQSPANLPANRTLILPSNAPANGYVLTTNASGVTQWGAMNPASATLASISLTNEALGSTNITNGGVDGGSVNQRFFQKFDTTVTDPNGRFNLSNGTYTVAQSGIYLISAYIMPNSTPARNLTGFFYPVNLEIRKNAGGNPSGGTIIMDNATIRWATPQQPALRYSVVVTGMVSLNAGDTLNAVVYLTGTNAAASASSGISYPTSFNYANFAEFKALFSVTAL
ncbi:hypothetical protein M9991_16820 [Chryseobacterium gallinarum]|uniref:hypothetical protein n=1 Tax=Chryseobacterium gallinarum TaxID=1324352 RepID=UPI002023C011|nr:hypothetical protein [Chryseobacterium gallinarum]MCL8538532.1 hypothetical protein [Chryseobacterium gallinarum]